MPTDSFARTAVGEDTTTAAMNEATYAFARPTAMQGRPAEMALAIASLDALAGQFYSGARWMGMNSLAKQEMLQARAKVRQILGVPERAPSQDVVDDLVGASQALDRSDKAGAIEALTSPYFTLGPEATLSLLAHFPSVPVANHATAFASRYLYPGGSSPFGW